MNVRILTRKSGYNFGSSLQAYAIHKALEKLGYSNLVLNYDEYYRFPLWRIKPFLLRNLFVVWSLFPKVSCLFFKHIFDTLTKRFEQIQKFDFFEKKFINPTNFIYRTSADLAMATQDCDFCVCGSDQIWNPLFFDPNFFLCFCNVRRTKLVAYAPSFGASELTIKRSEISTLLMRFSSISVRETTGQEIIQSLIGQSVPVVLDPTMLLTPSDWNKLDTVVNVKSPYILCYFLGNQYIPYNYISDLQKILNISVVNITTCRTRNKICGIQMNAVGPCEFISLIKNAEYICTDSFHATVFSILYHRDFSIFNKFAKNHKAQQYSRIETLLSYFGLDERMVENSEEFVFKNSIDYRNFDARLSELQNISGSYIKKAFGDLKE